MAWYKTGAVTINNGATSVTGIGTKFVSNSRVGDGFRGPDGEWYELINQGSETTIGIYPAYAGPSVVASTDYMIAPLQGYNKETADRLRSITDSFRDIEQDVADAEASAVAAKASEDAAKVSENNAKTSETNTAASKDAAKTSETNAKTSETNAKTSETNAKTSETNAKTSEINAAASAGQAANKQPLNANLTMLSSQTATANRIPFFSSATTMSLLPAGAFGKSILSAETSSEVQSALSLVPTQGVIDTTSGRILKVGDYGLGGAIPVQDANLANTINGGLYKLVTPFTNGPTAAAYIIQTLVYDAEVTQIAYVEGSTTSVKYMRQYRSGWQAWVKMATAPMAGDAPPLYTGNIDDVSAIPYGYVTVTSTSTGTKPTGKSFGFVQTFGQAPSASSAIRQIWNDFDGQVGTKTTWVRDKYGTAAFGNWRLMYDQNTVLGTVANPSSPNGGSIIEFNSNANGAYIRFLDGTQIAWRRIGSTTATGYPLGTTGLLGGDAFGGAVPINFSAIPAVTCSMTTTAGNPAVLIASQFAGPTVSSFGNWRAVVVDQSVLNNGIVINLIAVGRWY